MGLFSWECRYCGHPLLCDAAVTRGVSDWMTQAVAVLKDETVIQGEYDGYGRVGSQDTWRRFGGADPGAAPDVYHLACWRLVGLTGRPRTYQGGSERAADQGWFFDEGAHDVREEDIKPAKGDERG
jgi:hypothetical protein